MDEYAGQMKYAKNQLSGSGHIGSAGQISGGLGAQVAPQETLPGVLSDIEKLASQIEAMTRIASENLWGVIPRNPQQSDKLDRPSTILSGALTIRSILREAVENQQRTLNTLAL